MVKERVQGLGLGDHGKENGNYYIGGLGSRVHVFLLSV